MKSSSSKQIKTNQIAYTIEAALEYFVDIMVKSTFLTAVLLTFGASDGTIGIISTLFSLGFTAQFLAVMFLRPKNIKLFVTVMSVLNQILFAVLYLIPGIKLSGSVKILIFAAGYLAASIIFNIASPFKLSWLMSYVPDNERGKFTANKEIISLISGMVFSMTAGFVIDYFKATNRSNIGFLISAITILILCLLHLYTLIIVKDPEDFNSTTKSNSHKMSVFNVFKITIFDRCMRKVIFVDVLWQVGTGISFSFVHAFMQSEDTFNLGVGVMTVLSSLHCIARALVSRRFGKYADKTSWSNMLSISFAIAALSFFINTFTSPDYPHAGIGIAFFVVFYILYGIYMAGSNSGIMNITFDYTTLENRSYALGVKSAIGGLAGFLASVIGAEIINAFKNGGINILGLHIYPQQLLSLVACLIFTFLVIYVRKVIMKLKTVPPAQAENHNEFNLCV